MKKLRLFGWELRIDRWEHFSQADMAEDFSIYLITEIEKLLESHGCSHGTRPRAAPMFLPEAVACALRHARERGRADGEREREGGGA